MLGGGRQKVRGYLLGPGWEAEWWLHCDGGVPMGFANDQSPVVKVSMKFFIDTTK